MGEMRMAMNERGVFITFMAFLLIGSILLLHNASQEINSSEEAKLVGVAAFNAVNDSFNNLFEEVVGLNKEGYAKDVQQRSTPFSYDLNGSTIVLGQELPIKESILHSYFDALNLYSVFANQQEEEGSMQVATTPTRDTRWGGTEEFPTLSYVILPQCLILDVNNGNRMTLRAGASGLNDCTADFSYASVRIIDVNVRVDSSGFTPGDAGTTCNGAFDSLGCVNNAFDPDNPLPYAAVRIFERNTQCPGSGCMLTGPTGIRAIAAHFDPNETIIDSIVLRANANDSIKIKVGKEFAADNLPISIRNGFPSSALLADVNITFTQRPTLFYFTGFGIEVSKPNFSVLRRT